MFLIETKRLIIKDFNIDDAYAVHINSLDEDNKRFVPDEVFETIDDAKDTVEFLMGQYESIDGPFVYPIFIKESNINIGYVQLIKMDDTYEIGYHIAKRYTGNGYAKEAVSSFLPEISKRLGINMVLGICLKDNIASYHVLLNSGFEKVFEGIGEYQGEKREIIKCVWKVK